MPNAPKLIGLISDTHGLLRKEAVAALRGSELVVHAGDVGKQEILEELERIAPVVAVRGTWTLQLGRLSCRKPPSPKRTEYQSMSCTTSAPWI